MPIYYFFVTAHGSKTPLEKSCLGNGDSIVENKSMHVSGTNFFDE